MKTLAPLTAKAAAAANFAVTNTTAAAVVQMAIEVGDDLQEPSVGDCFGALQELINLRLAVAALAVCLLLLQLVTSTRLSGAAAGRLHTHNQRNLCEMRNNPRVRRQSVMVVCPQAEREPRGHDIPSTPES